MERTAIEGEVAVGREAPAILCLQDTGAHGGGARVSVGAPQKPQAGTGLVQRERGGAVVCEDRAYFVVARGVSREREGAWARADKGHRTGIGENEGGIVCHARTQGVVAVVAGGVEGGVAGKGEKPVDGEGGGLGKLDEVGVGAGVLQGAAVEHKVGGGIGGGADGAGHSAIGEGVDCARSSVMCV